MTTKDITYQYQVDHHMRWEYYTLKSLNRSYLTRFGITLPIYDLNYKLLIK